MNAAVKARSLPDSPYPGLRPFQEDEWPIFYGRSQQVGDLLAKLEKHHFLAVVGASGCGKSSLVRAGLLHALDAGFLSYAGDRWLRVVLTPGNHPIENLARALALRLPATAEAESRNCETFAQAFLRATLTRGPQGLSETLQEAGLPAGSNVLVLIDQFEELFRLRGDPGEAAAFVALLLHTARTKHVADPQAVGGRVYVVLTMRSDYLGDCDVFEGLPEAINEGQFLTPRMTPAQTRQAIVRPAERFGGSVEPELVDQLLNTVGTASDQLPLLQHVLLQLWLKAVDRHRKTSASAPAPDSPALPGSGPDAAAGQLAGPCLAWKDYQDLGDLDAALDLSCELALRELHPDGLVPDKLEDFSPAQRLAQVLFRCIAELEPTGRDRRRPTTADEVLGVAGMSPDGDSDLALLTQVVDAFRAPGRSFLTPAWGISLTPDKQLDISHESLIRRWKRLEQWLRDEAKSAETFRHLVRTAQLWEQGQDELAKGRGLERYLDWRDKACPNTTWAHRYGGGLELARHFLKRSIQAQQAEQLRERKNRERLRWWTRFAWFAAVMACVAAIAAISFSIYAVYQKRKVSGLAAAIEADAAATRVARALDELGRTYDAQAAADIVREIARPDLTSGQPSRVEDPAACLGWEWDYLQAWFSPLFQPCVAAASVDCLTCSDDGRYLAGALRETAVDKSAGLGRGVAQVWEVTSEDDGPKLVPRGTFREHPGDVAAVAFARNGDVYSADLQGNLFAWQPHTGRVVRKYKPLGRGVRRLALCLQDRQLVALTTGPGLADQLALIDLASGAARTAGLPTALTRSPNGGGGSWMSFAVSPDQRWLAIGYGGMVALWDLIAHGIERPLLQTFAESVTDVAFHPAGHWMAVAFASGLIEVGSPWSPSWSLPPDETAEANFPLPPYGAWRGRAPNSPSQLGASRFRWGNGLTPAGGAVLTAGMDAAVQITPHLWSEAATAAGSGRRYARLPFPNQRFQQIAFSADGELLCSAGDRGAVACFDARPLLRDNPRGTSADDDGSQLSVLGVIPGRGESQFELTGVPGNEFMASATLGALHLWRPIRQPPGHFFWRASSLRSANRVAVSPDGFRIAVAESEAVVSVWDTLTGEKTDRLELDASRSEPDEDEPAEEPDVSGDRPEDRSEGHEFDAPPAQLWTFLGDGRLVTVVNETPPRIQIHDVASRRPLSERSPGPLEAQEPLRWIVASHKTQALWLVGGGVSGDLHTWDLKEESRPHRTFKQAGHVSLCGALDREGGRLVSGGQDGSLVIFDVPTGIKLASRPGSVGRCVVLVAFQANGQGVWSLETNNRSHTIHRTEVVNLDTLREAGEPANIDTLPPDWAAIPGRTSLAGPDKVSFGERLLFPVGDRLGIWRAAQQRMLNSLGALSNRLTDIAASDGGEAVGFVDSAGIVAVFESVPPASQQDAVTAWRLVDKLFTEELLSARVVKAIRQDPGLTDGQQRLALRLVRNRINDVASVNQAVQQTLCTRGLSALRYERALRAIRRLEEVAGPPAPSDPSLRLTRGMAELRTGDAGTALATLSSLPDAQTSDGDQDRRTNFRRDLFVLLARLSAAGDAAAECVNASLSNCDAGRARNEKDGLLTAVDAGLWEEAMDRIGLQLAIGQPVFRTNGGRRTLELSVSVKTNVPGLAALLRPRVELDREPIKQPPTLVPQADAAQYVWQGLDIGSVKAITVRAVVATDDRMTPLAVAGRVAVDRPGPVPRLHLLLLGPGTSGTSSASDVQALRTVLPTSDLYQAGHVTVLLGDECTRERCLAEIAALRQAVAGASRDDLAVVMFSGQGVQRTRGTQEGPQLDLLMAGGWPGAPIFLTWEELRQVQPLPCQILFLLDCCHAGLAVEYERQRPASSTTATVSILASCEAGQLSYEREGGGVFSRLVVQGLTSADTAPRDGWVVLKELAEYVRTQAPANQTPVFWSTAPEQAESLPLSLAVAAWLASPVARFGPPDSAR